MKENIEIHIVTFDAAGEIIIIPSSSSSKNDFNFFEGKWKIRNKKLKARLENCSDWIEFD